LGEQSSVAFVRRVVVAHTLAYFVAGIFGLVVMDYRTHYASESMSLLMRPVESPWVALGPALQLFRGAFLGLVLLPFRAMFAPGWRGTSRLALLIFGLSYASTIGPAPGSFDGLIYTVLPLRYHLLGIPETLIYVGLFCAMVTLQPKRGARALSVLGGVAVALVVVMSLLGYLQASGRF
jgi:hypothetical protein